MERTIFEIRKKQHDGKLKVLDAYEFHKSIEEGAEYTLDDIDVITTGTRSIQSGTYMVGSFKPLTDKKFVKAKKLWLNGIEASVGACPNESIGFIDFILMGTSYPEEHPEYCGGHLFRELVEGKLIDYSIITTCGKSIEGSFTIDDMDTAVLMGSRNGMKNYTAFVNTSNNDIPTIFGVNPLGSNITEATFSGSGICSPLENDPLKMFYNKGFPICVNGALGVVMGEGTRSSEARKNVMTSANMKEMSHIWMGGFKTGKSAEVIQSLGSALPILTEEQLKALHFKEEDIELPVVDVDGREQVAMASYGDVWKMDYHINYDYVEHSHLMDKGDYECPAQNCPTGAFDMERGIDREKCYSCGYCVAKCPHGAFHTDMGKVVVNGVDVPVVLRQTDRRMSIAMAREMKKRVLEKEFPIASYYW